MKNLRLYIRHLLEQEDKKNKEVENLLTEPDETEGHEDENEASSGGVAGVSVPLGAGPNYPKKTRRIPGTRSPNETAAAAFGGGTKVSRKK